jgi:CRP-like cAMP-binding protein
MTQTSIIADLKNHQFLQGLTDAQLATISELTAPVSVPAGQFLGREHEPARFGFLIQSGRVAIDVHTPHRGEVRIETIGPGEIVGWSWMIPPHSWRFNAKVVEPVTALRFDGEKLRKLCQTDHELGNQLLQRLVMVVASRLAATRVRLLDIYK